MRRSNAARLFAPAALCALLGATPPPHPTPHAAHAPIPQSLADLNAAARAEGNRKPDAVDLGRHLLKTVWPAQILKIRVDGAGRHEVAGLMVSGVKFHGKLDEPGFLNEIGALVSQTFAASHVEEVDIWAVEPIPFDLLEPVTGDYAQPTDRIVFAVTVRRPEKKAASQRLHQGKGVYWQPDFRTRLRAGGREGPVRGSPNPASSPST